MLSVGLEGGDVYNWGAHSAIFVVVILWVDVLGWHTFGHYWTLHDLI